MPRNLRTIEPGFAHHITQRGVDRQKVFFTAADRNNYLALMQENLADTGVSVLAYCLMSNHVHWILGAGARELAGHPFAAGSRSLRPVPERATVANRAPVAKSIFLMRRRTDEVIERDALCGIEPGSGGSGARSGRVSLVQRVVSSAGFPAQIDREIPLERSLWREGGGAPGWRELLEGGDRWTEVVELRSCTYSVSRMVPRSSVRSIETRFGRCWIGRGRGRKSQDSLEEAERSASSSGSSKGSGSG